MTVKGKPDKYDVKGVVCSIPCECGSLYIGETGRTLRIRLMENRQSVHNRDTNIAPQCTWQKQAIQYNVNRLQS